MAYGTPSNPVSGTVITVAYAVANILDPLRWLRLLTGNADPPGSSYVVVSTSTSGTTWAKVPADALAAGAAVASLGYTPANRAGDTFTGQVSVPTFLTVLKIDDVGNGGRLRLQGSSGYVSMILENTLSSVLLYNESDLTKLLQFSLVTGLLTLPGSVSAVAGEVAGLTLRSAVATGTAPLTVASTTQVANLNASQLEGTVTGTTSGTIPVRGSGGRVDLASVADLAGDSNALGGVAAGSYGRVNSASVAGSSGGLSLTTTMQTVPGCSIVAPTTGTYLVVGSAYGFAQPAGLDVTAQIAVAGSLVGAAQKVNQPQFGTTPDASAYGGGVVMYTGSITAGQAVDLRAKSAALSTSTIDNGQLVLIRIA